jgi:hypothetical protein
MVIFDYALGGPGPEWQDWTHTRAVHEDALLGLGYLSRLEFPFTNRTLNAYQLIKTAQSRFASKMTTLCVLTNGQAMPGNSICTNSVVQVTAPGTEKDKWAAIVSEFDERPNGEKPRHEIMK